MSTLTLQQQQSIADLLAGMTLPQGMGTAESACSIAAINLALSGELTDQIPDCMSAVIGRWIIGVQDAMPADMRNGAEWKRLLPLAAGTGRDRERERLVIVMDWMWNTVLPTVQPAADASGFGSEWRTMLSERTANAAANAANAAAYAAYAYAANAAAYAAYAAVANAAVYAAYAAVANAAAVAAAAASANAYAARAASWQQFNPCALLEALINA